MTATPPSDTRPPDPPGRSFSRAKLILLTVTVGLTSTLAPVSTDTFLPSIPKIAEGLQTSVGAVTFSLAALMLGNAIGQLLGGPLSDRFGRKPVIIGVLAVFVGTAFAAAFATSIEMLIALRFIQGMAQAGGRILGIAVARDLFDRERLGKMVSDIMMIMSIVTIINPIVGGLVAQYLPWPSVFVLMGVYASVCIVLVLVFQPETLAEKDAFAIRPANLLANMVAIGRSAVFRRYVLCSGFAVAGFGVFLAGASPLLVGTYGVQPAAFGYYFAAVTIALFCGSWLAGRLVGRIGIDGVIAVGSACVTVGGTLMAVLAFAGIWTAPAMILPMCIYMMGLAMLVSQGSAGALQPFASRAGSASALLGFVQTGMMAIAVTAISVAEHTTPLPIAMGTAAMGLVAAGIYVFAIRPAGRSPKTDE